MSAYTGYVGTLAGLITPAQQTLNAALHSEYVTATGGDPDQAAVSQAWTDYYNTMATADVAFAVGEAGAAAGFASAAATADEDLANDEATEAATLTNANAAAYTTWTSTVAAAATSATNDLADAGLLLAQSMNGAVSIFLNSATSAGKALADASVAEGASLADTINNAITAFTHSYIGAAVSNSQDVLNEGRTATKNADSALTALSTGITTEQHDLNIDSLDEGKVSALAFSVVDDAVTIAHAVLDAAFGVLSACQSLAEYMAMPFSSFTTVTPVGGSSPMTSTFAALPLTPLSPTTPFPPIVADFIPHVVETFADGRAYDSFRGACTSAADILTFGIFDFESTTTSLFGNEEAFEDGKSLGPLIGYPLLTATVIQAGYATGLLQEYTLLIGRVPMFPMHTAFQAGAGTPWLHFWGQWGRMGLSTASSEMIMYMQAHRLLHIAGIPILSASGASSPAVAWTCLTEAGSAFIRGWFPFL